LVTRIGSGFSLRRQSTGTEKPSRLIIIVLPIGILPIIPDNGFMPTLCFASSVNRTFARN
jgi:hypothetical protein